MIGLNNSSAEVKNEVSEDQPEKAGLTDISAKVLDGYEVARFWSRVEVRKRNQCWPWRYGSTKDGYGEYRIGDSSGDVSSRVAYRIATGPIPNGMVVRHTCDNRLCCNPSHLVIGTHADNVADRVARGRSAKGESHGKSVLNEMLVRVIRSSPLSDKYFADRLGVHEDTIRDVRSRKTWSHVE